jgi:hypothetical protein
MVEVLAFNAEIKDSKFIICLAKDVSGNMF